MAVPWGIPSHPQDPALLWHPQLTPCPSPFATLGTSGEGLERVPFPTHRLNEARQLNVPFDGCLAEPEPLSLLIKGLFPEVAQAAVRAGAREPFTFN